MISLKDCKHGRYYKGNGVNFTYGCFDSNDNCFVGLYESLGNKFLAKEPHSEINDSDKTTFEPIYELYRFSGKNVDFNDIDFMKYLFLNLKNIEGDQLTDDEQVILNQYYFLNVEYDYRFEFIKKDLEGYDTRELLLMVIAAAKLKINGKI